jgi:linoleoyl-CoA desaturase
MNKSNISFEPLRFVTEGKDEFSNTLRKRINSYFKDNNISRYGDYRMYLKTLAMFSLYLIPYFIFISGVSTNMLFLTCLAILIGLGKAGIGFSVMHDANHGSYSKYNWINNILGHSINFAAGASAINWKIQHNVLHHTYTNIEGMDEDIELGGDLMRFTKKSKKTGFMHKYQYIYAWFLYGFLTLNWTFLKDFAQVTRYNKMGLLKTQNTTLLNEILVLIVTKIVYFGYIFVLPIYLLDISFWQMAWLFFVMHFVTGSILSWVFQIAHVVEETVFPQKNEQNEIYDGFFAHQLKTTANFRVNKLFSWFIGGLNYQIEHHLFPNISHVHYPKITSIVKETAIEFGLPYNNLTSFREGMRSHLNWLKTVGKVNLSV